MPQDTINEEIKQHEGLIFYTLNYLKCGYSADYISAGYEALWRACETYDYLNGAEFSTYAVTCIKNAIYDVIRRQKEVTKHEISIEDIVELYVVDNTETTGSTHTEVRQAVDEALNHFTGTKLKIVQTWIITGMSATAIAQEVGCSQSYASQIIKEAKVFLRKGLLNAGYRPRVTEDSQDF